MDQAQVMAYCVKEKAQKPMNDAKQVTLKNGKLAMQGICSSCGTKMMKFVSGKKETSPATVQNEPAMSMPSKENAPAIMPKP
ncbi:MAG: hypothetical protein HY070_08780 [Chloroflexi bacterium]|nr:hypothetical protein [Chloroflexota bacterium]